MNLRLFVVILVSIVASASYVPAGKLSKPVSECSEQITVDNAHLLSLSQSIDLGSGSVNDLSISADDRFVAIAVNDTIRLIDTVTYEMLAELSSNQGSIRAVEFHPEGDWLFSAGTGNIIHIWDIHTGSEVQTLNVHTDTIADLAISSDGMLLASASYDRTVVVWDTNTFEVIQVLEYEANPTPDSQPFNISFTSISFAPDDDLLLAGATSVPISVMWKVSPLHLEWTNEWQAENQIAYDYTGSVSDVDFSQDGTVLGYIHYDHLIQGVVIVNTSDSNNTSLIPFFEREVVEILDFGSQTSLIAIGGFPSSNYDSDSLSIDRTMVKVMNWETGEVLSELSQHQSSVEGIEFSYHGHFLVTSEKIGVVYFWKLSSNGGCDEHPTG
jgi:WD40 repeat protein